jgi:hypothetical protein
VGGRGGGGGGLQGTGKGSHLALSLMHAGSTMTPGQAVACDLLHLGVPVL